MFEICPGYRNFVWFGFLLVMEVVFMDSITAVWSEKSSFIFKIECWIVEEILTVKKSSITRFRFWWEG
jgi:hypothetical protein